MYVSGGNSSYSYAYTRIGSGTTTTGTDAGCLMECVVYSNFANWNGRRPGEVSLDVYWGSFDGRYCFLDQ